MVDKERGEMREQGESEEAKGGLMDPMLRRRRSTALRSMLSAAELAVREGSDCFSISQLR